MSARKIKIIKFLLFFCLVCAFVGACFKDIELFQSSMIAFLSLESVLNLLKIEKLEEKLKEEVFINTTILERFQMYLEEVEKRVEKLEEQQRRLKNE